VIDKVVECPSGFAYSEAVECQSIDIAALECRSGYGFVDEDTDIQFWEPIAPSAFKYLKNGCDVSHSFS
jgi:hypothetical protein